MQDLYIKILVWGRDEERLVFALMLIFVVCVPLSLQQTVQRVHPEGATWSLGQAEAPLHDRHRPQ